MAYELTFTVHPRGTSQCDLCSSRVGYGFQTTAHGTPIFFHCVTCVYTTYSEVEVDGALRLGSGSSPRSSRSGGMSSSRKRRIGTP